MGMLGLLLNRKSDLSVRNGVLLYMQLIRPLMVYACSAWRSAVRSHIRRLQVLESKCLCLATGAPWYVSNRQIHEDLGVPLLAYHLRVLTESFDSKLADVGNPLLRQLGRYLGFPRADPVSWRESQGRQGTADQLRRPLTVANSTNESHSVPNSRAPFGYPDWDFPWFSSVVRQMPGYSIQSGDTARNSPPSAAASPKHLITSHAT